MAILRWNRSTAGVAAPICARTVVAGEALLPDQPPARTTPPRPAHAPHGRESERHLETMSRDAGDEHEAEEEEEERDLRRMRRAEEAALYMGG